MTNTHFVLCKKIHFHALVLSLGKRNPRPEASMASTLVPPFPPKFGPTKWATTRSNSAVKLPNSPNHRWCRNPYWRRSGATVPTVENGCNHLLKHATSLAPSCRFCKVKSQLLGSQSDFHGHPSLGLQIASDGNKSKTNKIRTKKVILHDQRRTASTK